MIDKEKSLRLRRIRKGILNFLSQQEEGAARDEIVDYVRGWMRRHGGATHEEILAEIDRLASGPVVAPPHPRIEGSVYCIV